MCHALNHMFTCQGKQTGTAFDLFLIRPLDIQLVDLRQCNCMVLGPSPV